MGGEWYRGKAKGMDADLSTRIVHASLFNGAMGFLFGATKGIMSEPATTSSASWKTATAQSWKTAAKESVFLATIGAVFVGSSAASEMARGKDDMYNRMNGACACGFLAGVRSGSAFNAFVACPVFAFASFAVDMADGRLTPPDAVNAVRHPSLYPPKNADSSH